MNARWLRLALGAGLMGAGCSAPAVESENVGQITAALDVCSEAVPANRSVDGFPAYAQCTATMSSAIWSNNGIDTSTTSLGADWVRTQFSGGYQCTELVSRYNHFKWGVDYHNQDAKTWCDGTFPATLVKTTVPVHGDAIVFDAGVCGADATTGHIALVDVVNAAAATVTIVEQNGASRRNAKQSCALCYLHVVANDGTAGDAGDAGVTTGTSATSTSGSGTSGASSTGGTGSSDNTGSNGSNSGRGTGGRGSTGAATAGTTGPTGSTADTSTTATGSTSGTSTTATGTTGSMGTTNGTTATGASGSNTTGSSTTGAASTTDSITSTTGGPAQPSHDSPAENAGCGVALGSRHADSRGGLSSMALLLLAGRLVRRRASLARSDRVG